MVQWMFRRKRLPFSLFTSVSGPLTSYVELLLEYFHASWNWTDPLYTVQLSTKVKILNARLKTQRILFLSTVHRTWRVGRRLVHKAFWWESLKTIHTLKDLGVDGMMIMKLIFKKWDGTWTGLIWFRIGTSGGYWWAWGWTFVSIKCRNFLTSLETATEKRLWSKLASLLLSRADPLLWQCFARSSKYRSEFWTE